MLVVLHPHPPLALLYSPPTLYMSSSLLTCSRLRYLPCSLLKGATLLALCHDTLLSTLSFLTTRLPPADACMLEA